MYKLFFPVCICVIFALTHTACANSPPTGRPAEVPVSGAAAAEATSGVTDASFNDADVPINAADDLNAADPDSADQSAENKDSGLYEILVTCESVLSNMDRLNPDKTELIPEDGVIYRNKEAEAEPGDSAFDALRREMRKAEIHLEYTGAPAIKSVYIEGINNLYEFDCGEQSGWTYKVNGESPGYSCSAYEIKPGDKIEFIYTCDAYPETG
jgi:hypothetical protein